MSYIAQFFAYLKGDDLVYSSIAFRTGTDDSLTNEFLAARRWRELRFVGMNLDNPDDFDGLSQDNVLAIHFADAGAQGEPGALQILYWSRDGLKVLKGNHAYGNLEIDAILQSIPVLRCLDSRKNSLPYPFSGNLRIPKDWQYAYMGALNHFLGRTEICERTNSFIKTLLSNGGQSWEIFDAVAWFCGTPLV